MLDFPSRQFIGPMIEEYVFFSSLETLLSERLGCLRLLLGYSLSYHLSSLRLLFRPHVFEVDMQASLESPSVPAFAKIDPPRDYHLGLPSSVTN